MRRVAESDLLVQGRAAALGSFPLPSVVIMRARTYALLRSGIAVSLAALSLQEARPALTVELVAQQAYLKASNTGAGDEFGNALAVSGETVVVAARYEDSGATGIDGDGSDNGATDSGSAYAFLLDPAPPVLYQQKISATSGGFVGPIDTGDTFSASEGIGDLDGDGIPDLAVGAPWDDDGGTNRGAVWILLLDRDGTVQGEQKISAITGGFTGALDDDDDFGASIAELGDLDGDLVRDLAVSAPRDDDGGTDQGAVWILFLDADGTVKAHQKISETAGRFTGTLDDGDGFGDRLTALGDLDGDGVTDLAVGAPLDDDGGTNRGAVWILFLDSDGTVASSAKISSGMGGLTGPLADGDAFGAGLADLGNLDGAGIAARALAVGAPGDDQVAAGAGAAWILFLASSGTVLSHHKITEGVRGFTGDLEANDQFGTGLESLRTSSGDVRLAVGTWLDDDGALDAGAVWILELDAGGSVVAHQKISASHGNFQGGLEADDQFGVALGNLGDLDRDGREDLAVGARRDDDGGTPPSDDRGAVYVLFLNDGTLNLGASATTWTGATDSDWTDPTNWSNGTPDMTKTAIIPDAATTPNDPVISVGGQQCNTLWVQSAGTLDISTGPELDSLGAFGGATVSGPITGGGNLVFEQAGTLAGAATISLPDVRADADLSVQGGPMILTGTLTGNQSVTVELGAKLEVQADVLVLGDLLLDGALSVGDFLDVGGILTSTSSGNVGSLEVGEIGVCAGGITVGQICFHGEVATSCPLNIENGSSSSSLVLDVAAGWPAGVSVDVGGTITLESSDFSIGGDLVVANGTLAIGVDGTIDADGANGIVIEAPGTLDIGMHQTLVVAPTPVTVRGKLNVGPGGELQLESNALTVEAGGALCLSGGASNLAGIVGANGGGYALSVLDGATIAAKNFAFTGMGPSGITIERDALIGAAPLDLRNGLFDLPAAGGRLLALERSAPATLRYLVFENTNAAGTANVHVPATSALITLVNWSGAFSGPTFEDDPGMQLDWGPPELTEASLSARWKPDHVQVAWTTTSEIDAEAFLLRRSIEPAGPFLDMHETPSTGPGNYSYADWAVAPGTAYRYRLHERLTHGVLVQLDEVLLPASALPVFLPNWGRPAPPVPPAPLPLVIWPGGSYPDVPSAMAALSRTHSGTHVSLELAPGRHDAFELHELPLDLRLAARAGAWIDASAGPVRITGLSASHSLELVGLTLDAGGSERLALELEDCAGVVLLDRARIAGGARLVQARAAALQDCSVSGGLAVERGSRAAACGAALARVLVEPDCVWREQRTAPALLQRGLALELRAAPGASAWLLCSPRLGWNAPASGRVEGTWLLERHGHERLALRVLVDGQATWDLDPEASGFAQALLLEDGRWRLSAVLDLQR
jgi:hypothetical protein